MANAVPDITSEFRNGYLANYVVTEVIHVFRQDARTGRIVDQESAISQDAIMDIDRVAKYFVACANAKGKGAYITPLNDLNVQVTIENWPNVVGIHAATMMMTDTEAARAQTVEQLIKKI